MASFRKSAANRQPRGPTINGTGHVDASKYKGRSGVMIPNRVFVGGICPTASESDLLPLFGKYGTVKAIKIVNDENGQSKRYGFVTYEKADDCLRLQHDGRDLVFNEKRLIVAPAFMKNPPLANRYPEPSVVPVTPNLYFTNNIPYQYQDGSAVYPSSPYVPPLAVIPTVSDAAYYQNNYGVPATPYQGTALYYPVPSNASPVVVGHQPYSQYQSAGTNNSVYVNSSPNSSSPPNPAAAKNCSSMTTSANSGEIHLSHNTPLISATQPNISTLPPPLPYHIAHQPQFYNGSIIPQYTSEVCYNMVHNAYYPMMAINSHEAYTIPYYELGESCAVNLATEDNHTESPNHYHPGATTIMSSTPELNGCDSSPTPMNNSGTSECKSMPPLVPPPSIPPPPPSSGEHIREYRAETNNSPPSTAISVTTHSPTVTATAVVSVQTQHTPSVEYTSSAYVQHRNGSALIYQNTPIPHQSVYFNSLYVTEPANAPLGQCQYSKNLSEHFVSDHLPKRETAKYQPKKYAPPPAKDIPPNIPKFPFYNNNYPGYVNRNIKEKDFKNLNGGKNPDMKMMSQQRLARNIANGNNPLPKQRVFHNQNQYGGPPRPKGDRMMSQNGHHPRNNPGNLGRQSSYDMTSAPSNNPYNGYPNYVPYAKNTGYEGHRKMGQVNNNNGNYRPKHDRQSGSNEIHYPKNAVSDEKSKKNAPQPDSANSSNNDQIELNSTSLPESKESQQQQQQQLCAEMQNLAV